MKVRAKTELKNDKVFSFWMRLGDWISPRCCTICGHRLGVTEQLLCGVCDLHLPRTFFQLDPYHNPMAQCFWAQIPIERAAALFFYEPKSEVSRAIHLLKYFHRYDIGEQLGKQGALEFQKNGFFEGIDAIVPVPLTKKRQRERGYNQSEEIARGISSVTGLPIFDNVVMRESFKGSQTQLKSFERLESVENVFSMINPDRIKGKHLLLVDDVMTTGATLLSCAKELSKVQDVKFSIFTLGFTKN